MVQGVVGSNPISHPTISIPYSGIRPLARRQLSGLDISQTAHPDEETAGSLDDVKAKPVQGAAICCTPDFSRKAANR